MHKVIKPFPHSSDGINVESLAVGDERDFGRQTEGLIAAGFIAPVGPVEADEPELPSHVEVEAPVVEEHHEEAQEEDLTPPAAEEHHTARRGRRPKAKAE